MQLDWIDYFWTHFASGSKCYINGWFDLGSFAWTWHSFEANFNGCVNYCFGKNLPDISRMETPSSNHLFISDFLTGKMWKMRVIHNQRRSTSPKLIVLSPLLVSSTLLPVASSQSTKQFIAYPSALTFNVMGSVFLFTSQIRLKFTSFSEFGVKKIFTGTLERIFSLVTLVSINQ